ncbi:MAG: Ribbon-helix-helix domain [Thermoanaerobacteraceae bacterium]|nr:Ribbon-helix-helix domain [Thermoanaerobacteraceae bacterium]
MALKRKQIYIEEDLDKKLEELSIRTGISQAGIIREAVGQYIARIEQQNPDKNPLEILVKGLGEGGADDTSEKFEEYHYKSRDKE